MKSDNKHMQSDLRKLRSRRPLNRALGMRKLVPELKMITDYLEFSSNLLDGVISRHALKLVKHDRSGMGEWFVYYENSEFILGIGRDRGGHISIDLGSKIRRKPRAHMRGSWSMSHLKGYLDKGMDHYIFKSIKDEISWLEENEMVLFDSSLLNSDALNQWAINASKRLFGQDLK